MDPVHFTGKEVLDMALRIEENGMRFYTDASKAAKSQQLKDLFSALAEEEASHIKTFLELKRALVGNDESAGFAPYIEDAQQYLKSMADTEVFTNPNAGKEAARALKNEEEAITLAIGMEKDSLLFYYELERMIRDSDKKVIEALIEQEKEHVRKLTNLHKVLFGK